MASSKAVELTKPRRRARRSVTHTDAIFRQLMEAHNNSTHLKATTASTVAGHKKKGEGGSDLLTVKNFGLRTGLHWPEDRVVEEIAGLISGFTRQQEEKLTVLRRSGRAVVETTSSMMEFDGTGDRVMFPFRSRQQIAAKLLDMFGDGEAKADVQVKPVRERSGPKMYIYHDGTGEATLQLAPTSTTDCSRSSGSTIGSRALAISAFQGKTKDEVTQPPPTKKTIRASESSVNTEKGNVSAPVTINNVATNNPRSSRFDARRAYSSSSSSSSRALSEENRACLAASAVGLALESHNAADVLRSSINSHLFSCDNAAPTTETATTSSFLSSGDAAAAPTSGVVKSTSSSFSSCDAADPLPDATSTSFCFPASCDTIAQVGGARSTSGSFFSSFDTAAAATLRAEGAPNVPDPCSLKVEPNEGGKMSKGPEFCSFEIEGPTSLTGVSVRPAWTSSPKGGCGSTFSTPAWLTPGGEPSAAITKTGNTSSTSETVPNFPPSVPLEERESLGLAFGASLTAEDWLLGTSLMLDVGSIF